MCVACVLCVLCVRACVLCVRPGQTAVTVGVGGWKVGIAGSLRGEGGSSCVREVGYGMRGRVREGDVLVHSKREYSNPQPAAWRLRYTPTNGLLLLWNSEYLTDVSTAVKLTRALHCCGCRCLLDRVRFTRCCSSLVAC